MADDDEIKNKGVKITSINQSGGITAHTVNQAPEPKLLEIDSGSEEMSDGSEKVWVMVRVDAPYTPGQMLIKAFCPSIVSLSVKPQRTGMMMNGHSGTRDDHAFTTIINPFGDYKIEAIKKSPRDSIEIVYEFG